MLTRSRRRIQKGRGRGRGDTSVKFAAENAPVSQSRAPTQTQFHSECDNGGKKSRNVADCWVKKKILKSSDGPSSSKDRSKSHSEKKIRVASVAERCRKL